MNTLLMQRYQIALGRGFKGGFRDFCRIVSSEAKRKEAPMWKKKRARAKRLEGHIVAIIKGSNGPCPQ